MPSPTRAIRPTGPVRFPASGRLRGWSAGARSGARSGALAGSLSGALLGAVVALLPMDTAQAQAQSGLWRSALRAAGTGGPVDGGWSASADGTWERSLRAGPVLADERIGWRHTWQDSGRYALWTGLGGALRESRQAFSLGGNRAFDASGAMSPMFSAGGEWRLAPGWRLMAEFDGVGGTRGRMLDLDARVQWDLSPQWYLGAGWRVFDATFDSPRSGGYGRWSGAAFSAGWRF